MLYEDDSIGWYLLCDLGLNIVVGCGQIHPGNLGVNGSALKEENK